MADHPPTDECSDMECMACSIRDCPFKEPLHYHHDGCPVCYFKIKSHPPTKDCPDMICGICAIRDCPKGNPLHYHNLGCPDCED